MSVTLSKPNLHPNSHQVKLRSMASKRKSKEIEGSGSGASRKQSSVWNHGIEFKDPKQRNRYKSLISRTISLCRYPDVNAMDKLGIDEHVIRLLNRLGLVEMLKPIRGFENFTYEFLSSLAMDRSKTDNPVHRIASAALKCWLWDVIGSFMSTMNVSE